MKKIIASVALVAVLGTGGLAAQELSISTTFSYESEYLFRGVQQADDCLQPSIEVGYEGAYLGLWASAPLKKEAWGEETELDVYLGYALDVTDMIRLDLGGTYYWYTETNASLETKEIYLGATFNVVASPALYLFYDFELEQFTIEGSVGHSIQLDDPLRLDLAAYLGYVDEGESEYDNPSKWYYYANDLVEEVPDEIAEARAALYDYDAGDLTEEELNTFLAGSILSGFGSTLDEINEAIQNIDDKDTDADDAQDVLDELSMAMSNYMSCGSSHSSMKAAEMAEAIVDATIGKYFVDDYWYYGVTADLVYSFTDNAYGMVGVRYAANSEDVGKDDGNLWWGVSFTAGF